MAAQNLSAKSRDKQLQKIRELWRRGGQQAAFTRCQDLLRNNPQHAPAHQVYAGFLRDRGEIQEASKHYNAACSLPDTTPQCYLDFAAFLTQLGQSANALEVLSVGFRKWPENVAMGRELGVALAGNDQHYQAMKTFEHCLALQPDDWICWNHLGCARTQNNHAEEALECFDKSLTLAARNPRSPASRDDIENIRLNKAGVLIQAGRTDAARELLNTVLAQNLESHKAWFTLANLTKCSPEQVEQMESCAAKARLSGNQDALRDLHFALGRSWDNAKDPEKAMAHFDAGNRIVRAGLDYDSDEVCTRVRRTPDYFPPEIFTGIETRSDRNSLNYRPIFIVGMPRCGSTLTEQILASHPQIVGAGEITTLPTIRKNLLGADFPGRPEHHALARDSEILGQIRETYLAEIDRIAQDLRPDPDPEKNRVLVVDKMLGNFSMIGMILQAIPEAQIIHCRRNRVDTCLSCYSKLFTSPVSYSYDQKELGEFYRAYEEQMDYWHSHVPASSLMESRYEDLIADTEGQARKLLEFVGVPWDPGVLDFYKQKRTVSTASMVQVRKPIYNSSVERWRPYREHLGPLLDALGIDPDRPDH